MGTLATACEKHRKDQSDRLTDKYGARSSRYTTPTHLTLTPPTLPTPDHGPTEGVPNTMHDLDTLAVGLDGPQTAPEDAGLGA